MRILVWVLRLLVFVLVLLFALQNTARVDVGFFNDYQFQQIPLIVVMLVAFVIGLLAGLLLTALSLMRKHRELARLRRQLEQAEKRLSSAPSGHGQLLSETAARPAPL